MRLHYIVPVLFLVLTACVTQQQMEERFYRSMQKTTHLDISNHELIVPECTQTECFEKYQTVQDLIDAEKYQEAIEAAVVAFDLDTAVARKIEIIDGLGENKKNVGGRVENIQTLGQTNPTLTIKLSKELFKKKSAPYFVLILIHELGHAMNYNRYYNLIKDVVGIDSRVSNHFLAEIIKAIVDKNKDVLMAHVKSYYHLGFIQEDRLIYQGIEITLSQMFNFINLLTVWIDIDSKYINGLDEAVVALFALKHRERLYLPWHTTPVQLQIENLRRGFQNSFYEEWRLQIETGIMTELRKTFNEFPDTEKEKFKRALIAVIEQKKREIETYLVENGL